jgi:hypothetical protein
MKSIGDSIVCKHCLYDVNLPTKINKRCCSLACFVYNNWRHLYIYCLTGHLWRHKHTVHPECDEVQKKILTGGYVCTVTDCTSAFPCQSDLSNHLATVHQTQWPFLCDRLVEGHDVAQCYFSEVRDFGHILRRSSTWFHTDMYCYFYILNN